MSQLRNHDKNDDDSHVPTDDHNRDGRDMSGFVTTRTFGKLADKVEFISIKQGDSALEAGKMGVRLEQIASKVSNHDGLIAKVAWIIVLAMAGVLGNKVINHVLPDDPQHVVVTKSEGH